MTATPARALPDPERAARFAFEPKFDGWRCLAFRTADGVILQSRQQRPLTRYFPEVAAALAEHLPWGTVVDGELVVYRDGRLDFAALQRRIHPAAMRAARGSALLPATLVVFDLLAISGQDLRGRPYWGRREHLEHLMRDPPAQLAVMPSTRDLAGACAWMIEYTAAGVEGVVVKDVRRAYRPGRTSWQKVRTYTTTEAVVGGVLGPRNAPEALLLGRPAPDGRLRVTGRSRPLLPPTRHELGRLLGPPQRPHPWPSKLPSSRFGQLPPQPIEYTPVEPALVVEVEADTCWEQSRWRHPVTFCRIRLDLHPGDLLARRNRPGVGDVESATGL
jgi:ATP-dependent DNA ligase